MNGILNGKTSSILQQNQEILAEIQSIDNSLDDSHHILLQLKEEFDKMPGKNVLIELLHEIKNQPIPSEINSTESHQQLSRLNNLILSEGLEGSEKPVLYTLSVPDQLDYQNKIAVFRKIYEEEMSHYKKSCQEFKDHVVDLLEQQSTIRPVSEAERDMLLSYIQQHFQKIEIQLKESICQAVMVLKSRFLEERRKKKTYPNSAIDILNEFFYKNIANPFPTEAEKEGLAERCQLTVTQVNNWLGNKRLQYQQTLEKSNEKIKEFSTSF